MKILIIGGTGAMGAPLASILKKDVNNTVHLLARKKPHVTDLNNVEFIKADAFDLQSMSNIVRGGYDVIVDFMIYRPEVYKIFLDTYMDACRQYIFTSTSSVYGEPEPNKKITEETPRLYDTYTADRRNNNDVYHILKSNLENIVFEDEHRNWTMVRPYITFNTNKLPLVTWPKEGWLYRVINGKKVVLPRDVMNIPTTITYGVEVAVGISKLIGKESALGEIINIAAPQSTTWQDVLDIYQPVLQKVYGKQIEVFWVETSQEIWKECPHQYDFLACDRLLRKEFDTTKLDAIAGEHITFTDIKDNLESCVNALFSLNDYRVPPDPVLNGYMDRITGDKTSLSEFSNWHEMVNYISNRYVVMGLVISRMKNIKCWLKRVN